MPFWIDFKSMKNWIKSESSPTRPRKQNRIPEYPKYVAKVPEPAQGWTAFFVELTFDSGGPFPHKFTTEVHVVPDTLPFARQ